MASLQFNLLPDVKLAYIKTQRVSRTVRLTAIVITAIAVAAFVVILLTVEVVQKKQLDDSNSGISSAKSQLEGISGLNQVLTVQGQLSSLATLNQTKTISSRIFTYLPELTPSDVYIGQVNLDFTKDTITITGTADSVLAVNTFIDTLEFAQYKISGQTGEHPAFTAVNDNGFSITPTGASYSLTANFAPTLFSNSQSSAAQIVLQNQVTTNSELADPNNFLNGKGAISSTTQGGGQ